MHEMSIALNIIDIVTEEAAKARAVKVNEVQIEIGAFSGIEIPLLELAFSTAVIGTLLESAQRTIIPVSAKASCAECYNTYELSEFHETCPMCKSLKKTIIQGKELKIKAINID